MGLEGLQTNDSRHTSQLRTDRDDIDIDRLREAPPKPPEVKLNDQKPKEPTGDKPKDTPSSFSGDQKPASNPDSKTDNRNGVVIERKEGDKATAKDENNTLHEGKMVGDTFVGSDDHQNPDWIVRPDGSQYRAKYDDQQIAGQKPPLKSLIEITAKGEKFEFQQDSANKNRLVRTSADGTLLEERFNTVLDASGVTYYDDRVGVSTITLGDSTVEHGHIMFGEAEKAIQFRKERKAQSEDKHLHPLTSPTFCVDSLGRVSAILAPEKGGTEGCNDSIKGGTDRFFKYIDKTKELADVREIDSKGDYADIEYHSTRPMKFGRGTLDLVWEEPLQKGKPAKVAVVNHPNGSVDRVHNVFHTEDGRADGKVLYSVDRLVGKDPGIPGMTPPLLGIQHRDANGDKIGPLYTAASYPGIELNFDGTVKFTDRAGNQYKVGPDNRELVMNPNHKIYLKKDPEGKIVESGPLIANNPDAPFADRSYRMDERNLAQYTYSKEDNTIQITKTVDGEKKFPTSVRGSMDPNGELWHAENNGPMLVELPDLSTISIPPKGSTTSPLTYSFSNSEIESVRVIPEGSDQAFAVDILTNKASKDQIVTRLTAMTTEQATALGLSSSFQHYYLTQSYKAGDKTSYLIPPPNFAELTQLSKSTEASQYKRLMEQRQRALPMVFINPQVLANGSMQATSYGGNQMRFNLAKTQQDFVPTVIDVATHLAQSRRRFESLITKHRDDFDAEVRQGRAFAPPNQMPKDNPRWMENWAFSQFQIQLTHPNIQPAQLAFNYDCAIATILASQKRATQAQPIFAPPLTNPGSGTVANWNEFFSRLKELERAKAAEAEREKPKASPPPQDPQPSTNWDEAARGLATVLRALFGRR